MYHPTHFDTPIIHYLRRLRARLPEGRPLPTPVWESRHRSILILLWLHAIGIACFGILTNLQTSSADTAVSGFICFLSATALGVEVDRIPLASFANGLLQYVFDGGLIALAAILASLPARSRRFRAAAASTGLITASAVLVHLSGGYIEMHFHFFVALIIISLYQDWLPFLLAIGYVVIEHGVLGTFAPTMVYNHSDAWQHPWQWAAIHGGFVLTASFACLVNWHFNEATRAQTELILNAAGDGIFGLDKQDRITFINPAALRMLGQQNTDLIGQPLSRLLEPGPVSASVRGGQYEPFYQALRGGSVYQGSGELFKRGDGATFPVEYVSTPIFDHGSATGTVVIFRDITQQQRIRELQSAKEAAEAASHAKTMFLAHMSHELRTPLTTILGYSDLLTLEMETRGISELTADVEKIRRGGRHLLRLINNVLDLTKIESGKMEVYQEQFSAATMLEGVLAATRPLIEQHGSRFELAFADDLGQICTDQLKLQQVLINLLANAAKFTEQGVVTFTVALTTHDQRPWITFTIADTGIGMSAEQQRYIFEEFQQADQRTAHYYGGTGLGLALSRRFCQLLHADLSVVSSVNEGSTFVVQLPIIFPASSAIRSELEPVLTR